MPSEGVGISARESGLYNQHGDPSQAEDLALSNRCFGDAFPVEPRPVGAPSVSEYPAPSTSFKRAMAGGDVAVPDNDVALRIGPETERVSMA
jgi:hypothetical protein